MAKICIENIKLETTIGVRPDEQAKAQAIILSIEIETDITKAAVTDSIDDALDYQLLADEVCELVRNSRCALIENLAQRVLDKISSYQKVKTAKVKISKPHALEYADCVSIELAS